MKIFLTSLALLSLSAIPSLAETFAWKAPLTNLTNEGLETPGINRLERPPEESVFFSDGDVIWDLKAILSDEIKETNATPKWIVWNETTERIVASGSLRSVLTIQRFLRIDQLPTHVEFRIDIFRITSDKSPPDFSKNPNTSISAVCRSGQRFTTSKNEAEAKVTLDFEATYLKSDLAIDTKYMINAELPDTPALQITSYANLQNNTPTWVARSFGRDKGSDVTITAEILLPDGTPFCEAALRQDAGKSLPVKTTHREWKTIKVEPNGWLASTWVPLDTFIEMLGDHEKNEDENPFAETAQPTRHISASLEENNAPEIVSSHIVGKIWDTSDYLKRSGIRLSGEDFSGYDPITERFFLYSTNPKELNKFNALTGWVCGGSRTNIAIMLSGLQNTRLLGRAGRKASLKSFDTASEKSHFLEIEPTIGDNDTYVDLRLLYEEKSGEKITQSLNTATTLIAGKPQTAFKSTSDELNLKAEIIRTP